METERCFEEKQSIEFRFETANAIFDRDGDRFVKSIDNLTKDERNDLLAVLCKDRNLEFIVLLVNHWSFFGNRIPIRDQVPDVVRRDDVGVFLALFSFPCEINLRYQNGRLFDLIREHKATKIAEFLRTVVGIDC